MRVKPLVALLAVVSASVLTLTGSSLAAKPPKTYGTPFDTIHVGNDVREGTLPVSTQAPPGARTFNSRFAPMNHGNPTVGQSFVWLGLDDTTDQFILKFFTLRAIGTHGEVWVANNLNFPAGDCRNDGVRNVVTQAQVDYLLNQFDTNMYPKEIAAFSTPPDRGGENEEITHLVPPSIAALMHPQGAADRTVILVDNVRDDNYFDTNNANGLSYIAGFFSGQLNDLFDRNIMTIDGWDWLHRTGANPPDEPVAGNLCTSAPARPFRYEGIFAHEYQHLLEHYADEDEGNWINEGLADWAQTLTGYVDPARPITDARFDSHIQCFLGWLSVATPANPNPNPASGPENSLTRWSDQGGGEILCDYGATYAMMEMLAGRYGAGFMTALHNGDENGIAGLQEALAGVSPKLAAMDVLHDWSLMVALDGHLDDGMNILGSWPRKADVTTPTLDATINWNTPHAYDTAGAPSNGSDYVRLRDAAGNYLRGRDISSLAFQGSATLPGKPIQWTVAANPPLAAAGDAALFSGAANNRDQAIVREVTVPSGAGAALTFDALWNQELGWDFGFVQVSDDDGATYQSIACTDTTTTTDPGALPTAKENVPGFTGYSGGWKAESCSLAAYAGQTVLLAFRAFNDPAVLGQSAAVPAGFWVDDVAIGGTSISDGSSLADWQSPSQIRPGTVSGFTVTLLSIDTAKGKITVERLPLTGDFAVSSPANVQKYIDKNADFVGAIVFYDDPAETSVDYAPYRLTVNGVTQPGGGM